MPKMEQARTDHSCGGGWHAALDGGGGGGGGREIGFELIGVPFREAGEPDRLFDWPARRRLFF